MTENSGTRRAERIIIFYSCVTNIGIKIEPNVQVDFGKSELPCRRDDGVFEIPINYEKLGLTYFKLFFNLNIKSRQEFAKFEEYLLNSPNTIYIVHGIAMQGDIDVELIAPSNTDFFEFIRETKNRFPKLVADYNYMIYNRTLKVNYVSFY